MHATTEERTRMQNVITWIPVTLESQVILENVQFAHQLVSVIGTGK